MLDAGAGSQQFKEYSQHLKYVAQDFAQYIPSSEERGLQNPEWHYGELDIISDITDIPEPDSSFGAILCSEVLEHIPYPDRAIKEFSRLLDSSYDCSFLLTHSSGFLFLLNRI